MMHDTRGAHGAAGNPIQNAATCTAFLDAAHHALLDEIGRLELTDDENFCNGYCELVRRIELNFFAEELQMENIGYTEFGPHLEQHARLLSALHHVMPRVMEGDIALGRETVGLLPLWLDFHIRTMDDSLAETLQHTGTASGSD